MVELFWGAAVILTANRGCLMECLDQRNLDRREAELVEREDQLRKNVESFELERKRQNAQKAGLHQRKLALNRREIELCDIEDRAKLLEQREAAVTELEARLHGDAGKPF
jgi:hypothetical protein